METSEASEATTFINLQSVNLLDELKNKITITINKVENDIQPLATTDVQTLSSESPPEEKKYSTDREERVKCKECSYSVADPDKLVRHVRKAHRGENPFQCFMCEYSTYNKTLFEDHIRIHKGIKPYKCAYCPHRNVSKKNLKRHEKIHRPDNPLKCTQCDFIGRNGMSLDNHAKKNHPPETKNGLVCNWCEKKFHNSKSLVFHTTQIKTCDMLLENNSDRCDFTACSKYKMKLHRESEHGVDKKMRKDLWQCKLCDWSSLTKSRILLHLIHHPNQEVDETMIDVSILRKYGIM